MGRMPGLPPSPDPQVLDALLKRLGASRAVLPFDEFMDCVLYDPEIGYYRRKGRRVGYTSDSDFYTAASLGPVFGTLVAEAAASLLPWNSSETVFVELGPEPEQTLEGAVLSAGFADYQPIRPGDSLDLPPRCVLFSNEVLDAQPFRRLVRETACWQELGVRVQTDRLAWERLEAVGLPPGLPDDLPAGTLLDWPEGAHRLVREAARKPWAGLWLAFDYGISRETAFRERPAGTGRTYSRHQTGSDLLKNPGHTDITCHLIWEELETVLLDHRFREPVLESQEAFFMRHATRTLQALLSDTRPGFSRARQTLKELLHPGLMGRRFQVLHALRKET